jgi:hypothetical protein
MIITAHVIHHLTRRRLLLEVIVHRAPWLNDKKNIDENENRRDAHDAQKHQAEKMLEVSKNKYNKLSLKPK